MDWFKNKAIVVPYDFSDESVEAINVAKELAGVELEIHVIHVAPDLDATTYPGMMGSPFDDDLRKQAAKNRMVESLSDVASDAVSLEVRVGDPGHTIVDFANQIGAGLIVIPSHGRTGISRVFIGSVSERVVRHAHCPVLVLKPAEKDQESSKHGASMSSHESTMRRDDLLEVYSTDDPNHAELLRNSLHAEGMKCEIDGESQGGFAGLTSFPIKLLVRAEDYDRARKYLETHRSK